MDVHIFVSSPDCMPAEKRSALYWNNPKTSAALIIRRYVHHCATDSDHSRHTDVIKEDFVPKYYSTVATNV